jgi:hypothetical protein
MRLNWFKHKNLKKILPYRQTSGFISSILGLFVSIYEENLRGLLARGNVAEKILQVDVDSAANKALWLIDQEILRYRQVKVTREKEIPDIIEQLAAPLNIKDKKATISDEIVSLKRIFKKKELDDERATEQD